MEEEEHDRYAVTNLFRQSLHRKLDTSRMFTWGLIGTDFWGTQVRFLAHLYSTHSNTKCIGEVGQGLIKKHRTRPLH